MEQKQIDTLYYEIKDCLDFVIMLGDLKSTGVLHDRDPDIDSFIYRDIAEKLTAKYAHLNIGIDYDNEYVFYDFTREG